MNKQNLPPRTEKRIIELLKVVEDSTLEIRYLLKYVSLKNRKVDKLNLTKIGKINKNEINK